MISGPSLPPRSGVTKQLVIILHGWGADGANLIDLADAWSESLPDAYFIAPNAPHVCEVNPFGFQWFSLADRSPHLMQAGVADAAKYVNELIDSLIPNPASPIPIALVGFSQGTMTALHVALNRDDIACLLGYSGALLTSPPPPPQAGGVQEKSPRLRGDLGGNFPTICLIHGQEDMVVPFAAMHDAQMRLKAAGYNVQTHARPNLGHGIDMEGIEIGRGFLVEGLL